jgi:hypothetical protein
VEARIRDLQADARDAGRDPFATTAAKSGIWELRGVLDQLAEVSRPPHPTQGDEPMPGFHTDPNTIQKAADTPTAPTTLADLRARVQQRIEFCQHEATRAQQTPATVHHFETLAAELEWFLADIQALEQTEKNQLAALYADDALDRPGLLTDEQKQRNLEQLEAYTQEAQIPDGAPCRQVLRALQICASLWEPGARIQGNLRADDIVRACAEAITVLDALHNRA